MNPSRATAAPTILEFVTDPQLLGLTLSLPQRTLLAAIYGLPLSPEERDCYTACTGRAAYRPGHPFAEVTVVAGARSGKDSRIAAPIVAYEALFGGHEHRLAKGEGAVIPLVAQDREATRVAYGYIKAYLTHSPHLASMIQDVFAAEIVLTNQLRIVCFPCSQRSLRSWSIPVAVLDELGFYRVEGGANSDVEIQASIRRGMINFGRLTRLVKISTPYLKEGVLHDDFEKAYGQDDRDLLVWKASTALMNPSIKTTRLDRERRLDPHRFAREYEAEFAEDLEAFLPHAWVLAAVVPGRFELAPDLETVYVGAVDPSGGGSDAFSLAIVHADVDPPTGATQVIEDALKSWTRSRAKTVDLEAIVKEAAALFASYNITTVVGDKYSAGWVKQAFARHGMQYVDAPDKSLCYQDIEPLFAQGTIQLLDHPVQTREFSLLERRPRPGGKPMIDHPRGAHDDHANALALAAAAALQQAQAPSVDWAPTREEMQQLASIFPDWELRGFDADHFLR